MSKIYEVIISKTAEEDLNDIILYIAQDSVKTAIKIYDQLKEKLENLKDYPERGRIVPELLDQNIREYRELIERPWRIIYKIEKSVVIILTILDGRRNISDILTMKLLK